MFSIVQADCLDFLRAQQADSLDLVFGSPPYENCRLYLEDGKNLGIARKTDAWVAWMVEVYQAAQKACKGLVAFVVAGQTKGYKWSAGPALLMAELHRAGMNLRNPPIFSRVGIPGSGGPDWLRGDYEWIICTSRPGKLPWSDNTACGHPPKWAPGGEMSHRVSNGSRVNQWGHPIESGGTVVAPDGVVTSKGKRPSHKLRTKGGSPKDAVRDRSNIEKGFFMIGLPWSCPSINTNFVFFSILLCISGNTNDGPHEAHRVFCHSHQRSAVASSEPLSLVFDILAIVELS